MGLDHEKLTYRYSGRDFRLTDVQRRGGEGHPAVSGERVLVMAHGESKRLRIHLADRGVDASFTPG